MGTHISLSVQLSHSLRSKVMGLNRYILPMFLIILCCNILPTKEEETKEHEEERENWNLDKEKVMDRSRLVNRIKWGCEIFRLFDEYFCVEYVKSVDNLYINTATKFCEAILTTKEKVCNMFEDL